MSLDGSQEVNCTCSVSFPLDKFATYQGKGSRFQHAEKLQFAKVNLVPRRLFSLSVRMSLVQAHTCRPRKEAYY